jgi:phosphoribosylformylglycinamidine synthase subunit PurQ / glutaminase
MNDRWGAEPRPRVAVVQLPGVNCEYETRAVLERAELAGAIVRGNAPPSELEGYDAFVVPGGFSYEDRIRAGAVAAKTPVLDVIGRGAEAGKPVLGICNGAQILVEAGLVPGIHPGTVEMGLGGNVPWRSYYCAWVHVKVVKGGRETAFTSRFEDGEIVPVPMAHGQGRFTVRDPDAMREWADRGQVPLRYVTPDGDDNPGFPHNPNGSLLGASGITNPAGNVLAFMPHPERASWLRQVPVVLEGPWGERRRAATRDREALDGPGPGFRLFQSLADYLNFARPRGGRS